MIKVLSLLSAINFTLSAAIVPDTLWTKVYGGVSTDYINDICILKQGGFVFCGYSQPLPIGTPGTNIVFARVDNLGDTIWSKTFSFLEESIPTSITQTNDSGFILTGYTYYAPGDEKAFCIRANQFGDTLWTKTFSINPQTIGNDILALSDGGFMIVGETATALSNGVFPNQNLCLIRIDSYGDTIWTKQYGGVEQEGIPSIISDSDGFIIAGYTQSFGSGGDDIYVVHVNNNGDTLWTKTYGGPDDDWSRCIAPTNDGGFVITGRTESFGLGTSDCYVLRCDSKGDTLWTRTYGGNRSDIGTSVAQLNNGNLLICGSTSSYGAGASDIFMILTTNSGDTLFTHSFGGIDDDYGESTVIISDSSFLIGGSTLSYGSGKYDFYLIRLNLKLSINTVLRDLKYQNSCFSAIKNKMVHDCSFDFLGRSLNKKQSLKSKGAIIELLPVKSSISKYKVSIQR